MPVYVVTNQAGQPLEDDSSGFLCYLDPTAAQAALETAIGLDPTPGLRLLRRSTPRPRCRRHRRRRQPDGLRCAAGRSLTGYFYKKYRR